MGGSFSGGAGGVTPDSSGAPSIGGTGGVTPDVGGAPSTGGTGGVRCDCVIDAGCYSEGQRDPLNVCRICDPARSGSAWSSDDDATCDDGLFCNGPDRCAAGECSVHAGDPCATSQSACLEDQAACACAGGLTGGDCATCVVYVNGTTGSPANSGTSWDSALNEVTAGLDLAESRLADCPAPVEVWVAAGEYRPTQATDDPTATFQLRPNVALYGSFAGTERAREERVLGEDGTVLSGDLGAVNVYHVVTGADDAVIDGFVIANGYAISPDAPNQRGGGMVNDGVSPLIQNCTFVDNDAYLGGGLYNRDSSARVIDSNFLGNSGPSGAGVCNDGGSPLFVGCEFIANQGYDGAGMLNEAFSSPIIVSCSFTGNEGSNGKGGAIRNLASSAAIHGCLFSLNTSDSGGAIYVDELSSLVLESSTLVGNTAATFGGAIGNIGSSPALIENSVFWDNAPNDVEGASDGSANQLGSDPLFVDPDALDFRLQSASACVNSGAASLLPFDVADVDGDGDTAEPLPLDLAGSPRVAGSELDMGAYEKQ